MKKVVLFVAQEGFRDEEYLQPKQVLEQNKMIVLTASSKKGVAKGKFGAIANVDISIYDLDSNDIDGLFLVGGPGSFNYFEDKKIHKLLSEMYNNGKIIGAICAAPAILAYAGLLKGKNATSYEGVKEILIQNGANYTGKSVEVDQNIITADGPTSAVQFGLKIVELLNKNAQ